MDVDVARATATEALPELVPSVRPLVLLAPHECDWCWLFPFDSAHAIETGDLVDALMTGPLVVPKNGARPWVAPSSPPVERWLNEYAKVNGLPPVPVPVAPDPFPGADD
ncbi:MAG TPA: YrhB domain-containing protein [Actinoplanes sp.]|nr:YrhB domain-containing protein [Actinoplanes sp.]